MKKTFIKKQNKANGKGPKGKGFNSNKTNPKNGESNRYKDKNDYEIESISGEN